MSQRWAQVVRVAGAVACAALAIALAALALDFASVPDALADGDVRYRVSPAETDLWGADERVPLGLASRTLAVEDDLEFRRALRALRLARLDESTVSDPDITLRRIGAQARLEAIASERGDPSRRSRAAGLLGVLGLVRLTSETQDRTAVILSVLSNLRLAVALDPSNDDAKHNLELALQRTSGVELAEGAGGVNPAPGGSGVKGAGAGDPGSGY